MGILFIDLGEVRTFQLSGMQTIGRDEKNDIVVMHPTVSRHHARIEQVGNGDYVLTDFNSRNGTRVNGKSVETNEPLYDGARMRIGHVRAWYFKQMPGKLPRSISNRDRGIIFNCQCGQRLWSASDTAGMAVTCGGCNKSIEVPDPHGSLLEDSSGTVAGVTVTEVADAKAVVCGVCHWPIEKQEKKYNCPSCGMDFHMDCWRENRGCAAYGCSQVNVLTPRPARPAVPQGAEVSASVNPNAETAILPSLTKPGIAWAHALLALAVVGSLLGLLSFGIPSAIVALVALIRLLISRTDSKIVLLASVLIALLGTASGVMISRFWWLDQPLF